jgi:hypothetical protein
MVCYGVVRNGVLSYYLISSHIMPSSMVRCVARTHGLLGSRYNKKVVGTPDIYIMFELWRLCDLQSRKGIRSCRDADSPLCSTARADFGVRF